MSQDVLEEESISIETLQKRINRLTQFIGKASARATMYKRKLNKEMEALDKMKSYFDASQSEEV